MSTFVTLAEVLESRGAPLEEGEVWALLLGATETLVEISRKGPANLCSVITPGSMLLSPSGSVAFKTCGRSENVASFTSPETVWNRPSSSKQDVEKMVVFSLGMTLYWTVDYQLPQNQPVHLSNHLNSLLLSMCEEAAHRRLGLLALLEASEQHHKNARLSSPDQVIRQLALDVLQDPTENAFGNAALLTDRSQLIRDRLRGGPSQNSTWAPKGNGSPSHTFQSDSNSRNSDPGGVSSTRLSQSPYLNRRQQLNSRPPQSFSSSLSLSGRRVKDAGPEFVRMRDEPLVILELPNSIVSKRGKSCSTQRDLRVVMPNGQMILLKCDVKCRGGDVFDMIIAHSNLVEHFYFGLAYTDDDEFFFLDNETKISKVAPEKWKKVPASTFVLHFRIKFFVSDASLLLHKLTRHQYYLQLRRDVLEERLPCNENTGLELAALALQAEFGDSEPEVYGKNYYHPEHYISKSILEKRALPYLKEELLRLHTSNVNMVPEESELEFLKAIQQLPEYGVLLHRMAQEKKPLTGELLLGVCNKGVIVYEVKNNIRSASLRFHWRETSNIFAARRKFVIESNVGKKKHTFLMEKSKIAKYLCKLCVAQHKFHKEMSSRQLSHCLASEESIVQYAAVCQAQNNIPCTEGPLNNSRLDTTHQKSMSRLCDNIASRIENKIKQHRDLLERSSATSPVSQRSPAQSQKRSSYAPSLSSVLIRDTPTSPRAPEREIVCVTLKKDPKLGLGIVIVGEDSTGRLDLGIFIASVVPGGPADRDGQIRPGGRLISLNQTSLEGMSFSEVAEILQNSPSQVELIISQRVKKRGSSLTERSYESQTTLRADSQAEEGLDELVTMMMTPKGGSRLHVPDVRILNAQDDYCRSASLISLKPEEFRVQLKKVSGSLGINIGGEPNAGVRSGGVYVRSLVPGGAADQDGHVQPGDRLLEVDGSRLTGYSDQQAAECLAKTGEVVSLVLQRGGAAPGPPSPEPRNKLTVQTVAAVATQFRNNSCPAITMTTPFAIRPKDYSFVSEDNTLEVTLRKRLNGLGFSFLIAELDTSLDCGTVVRVKTLFPGQAAEESGLIQEGDVILAVNGESLKGLSYQHVLYLLKSSTSEVKLVICRPAAGTLPPISEKIGQLTCS